MMKENKQIEIQNFSKTYGHKVVFDDFNLSISRGDFVVILGPNGCGKTTLLHSIAGLEEYEGRINIKGAKLSLISQNPREMLLPWMNNEANAIFPMKKKTTLYSPKPLEAGVNMRKPGNVSGIRSAEQFEMLAKTGLVVDLRKKEKAKNG